MSESQHKNSPARTRAKPGAAKAVAKDPAVQTAQAEQDAAALKAKAESDALAQGEAKPASDAAVQAAQAEQDAIYILGAFTARSKADAGFWRSGVQFHRLKETLVLVVEQEPDATAAVSAPDHEAELVVYLTAEKAERVHREPNLVIEDIDLEDLIDPAGVINPDNSE
ncbi:hypothetical protein [Rheinheimera hassiensis]|uniref:hypothetical protein n=1 Tax=Rheinheimera hassiensis TaxID=1193627 RepID=UPI001F06B3BC|nr:hypothetical protein [Rheinheimera hassiensis]